MRKVDPSPQQGSQRFMERDLRISMRFEQAIAVASLVGLLTGCSGRAGRVEPPDVDPSQAANLALEAYDTDRSALLSASELEACPGLAAARQAYDTDGDDQISEQEIATRIESWYERRLALTSLSCRVHYKGKPLAGAEVVMTPEAYLGDSVKPARGTTTAAGSGIMAVSDDDLPEEHRGIKGVHYGTYKVQITHPEVELPAKYNTETTLGHEIAHDIGKPYATFNLQ